MDIPVFNVEKNNKMMGLLQRDGPDFPFQISPRKTRGFMFYVNLLRVLDLMLLGSWQLQKHGQQRAGPNKMTPSRRTFWGTTGVSQETQGTNRPKKQKGFEPQMLEMFTFKKFDIKLIHSKNSVLELHSPQCGLFFLKKK